MKVILFFLFLLLPNQAYSFITKPRILSLFAASIPHFTFLRAKMEKSSEEITKKISSAFDAHKRGLVDEAIAEYSSTIPLVEGQVLTTLLNNLGALYMSKGDYQLARDTFLAAIESSPDNVSALLNVAIVQTSKLGEHRKALGHCAKALRIEPSNYRAVHLMGNIMQEMGREEDAERYFVMAESLAVQQSQQTADHSPVGEKSEIESLEIFHTEIGGTFSSSIDGITFNMTCISKSPLIYMVPSLLNDEECEHIQQRAKDGRLEKSFIMGGGGTEQGSLPCTETCEESEGNNDDNVYRSSYNTWLSSDEILRHMQLRIATLTGIPSAYFLQKSEELQVVKYEMGGEFKVHHDSSAFHTRFLTALVYLNNVISGGETWFPYASRLENPALHVPETVDEAVLDSLNHYKQHKSLNDEEFQLNGIRISPVRGDAIIFFNHHPDRSGTIDVSAVHAGLPVKSSEKWVANYWLDLDVQSLNSQIASSRKES